MFNLKNYQGKVSVLILSFVFMMAGLLAGGTAGWSAYTGNKSVTVGGRATYDIYDEDTMSSDDAYGVATQQSIKAYIDGAIRAINIVDNVGLDIWSKSGATRSRTSTDAAPDGWKVYNVGDTGATRYSFADPQMAAIAATPYGTFGHAMYAQTLEATDTDTDEIGYNSGVSIRQWYIDKFRGQEVQAGFLVWTDPGTGGALDVFRPYIITCTNVRTSGISLFAAYSADYAGGGWEFMSATTTVPDKATAFEFGIDIKNQSALSGESIFIIGPTIIVNGSPVTYPVQKINETIFFEEIHDPFGSGGSNFLGAALSTIDLSLDPEWSGIIPDNVSHIYVTVGVNASYPGALYFYGDNLLGGVSFFGLQSGVSPSFRTAWIPVSGSGTLNIANGSGAVFSGTSLFVHGAKIR